MNRTLFHVSTSSAIALACFILLGAWQVSPCRAQTGQQPLSLEQIGSLTTAELAKREGYQSGDLITQSDVKSVLKALAGAGWKPADQKAILNLALPDNDALVRILGTSNGKKFMRQAASADVIFDRLDRVCRVSGGQRMIADLAKLPDGHKYAELKRPNGVPGLLELLPKTASGKRRSIKDYEAPTGRIYTEKQLAKRLEESFQAKDKKPSGGK